MNAILCVGCSSIKSHIPCLEADALFVAENFELAHKRFVSYPKYPVRKWEADILTGRVIEIDKLVDAIHAMPVTENMILYISSHGFPQKIHGSNHLCQWFGDENNWIPFNVLVQLASKICESSKVKRFMIVNDCCYSGLSKKDIRPNSEFSTMFSTDMKNMLKPKRIDVKPTNSMYDQIALDVKPHKKLTVLNMCKGNQTSFANFTDGLLVPVTTSGHSLGTNAWITAMNWYYCYGAGLNLKIQGKNCKARSEHAIMSLAQRRVNKTIKAIALNEWLKDYPKTTIQKFNWKGKLLFY